MNRLLLIIFGLLCGVTTMTANSSTFYSKVNVSVESGEGKVYASTTADVDEENITATSHSATFSSAGSSASAKSAEHTYYLFARPAEGYGFKAWNDGNSDNPREIVVKAEATDEKSPTTEEYKAAFEPSLLTVCSSDNSLGTASISKSINAAGDIVTLTATITKQKGNGEFGTKTHAGRAIIFEGWYDGDGNKISDELTTTYTVSKVETLEARFNREFTIKTDADGKIYGYYRLQTPYGDDNTNYFLCLTGNFQVAASADKRYLTGAVEFNQQPYCYNGKRSNAYAQSPAVFSDAGSILYVTGQADMNNINATASRTTVASNVIAAAQGTTTDYITKGQKLSLMTAATPGYYILYTTSASTTLTLQLNYFNHIWVSTDKPANVLFANNGDLDIQPVDEEHVDTNYFGAYPDASMEFEGGYWTSMYTSFPYECYAPDGVEAYVVNRIFDNDGTNLAVIKRLESGIVPAATPVLLKCNGLTPKENRLIPLLPDDSRLEAAAEEVGENLLTGEYGLWTGGSISNDYAYFTGRKTYEETMRVFSVNGEGTLGFYKLAANADGSAQELVPNKAYLDLTKIPEAARNAPFRIVHAGDPDLSGINEITTDSTDNAEEVIYDMYGRRVTHMTPGNIYIFNGQKILYR